MRGRDGTPPPCHAPPAARPCCRDSRSREGLDGLGGFFDGQSWVGSSSRSSAAPARRPLRLRASAGRHGTAARAARCDTRQTQLLERGVAARPRRPNTRPPPTAATPRVPAWAARLTFSCAVSSGNRGDLKRARDAALADLVRRQPGKRPAVEDDVARDSVQHAGDDVEQSRFPGTVGTDDGPHFSSIAQCTSRQQSGHRSSW